MKIRPDELRYLALEGGGGVGNAYPGALEALTALQIIKTEVGSPKGHVLDFAGSSAGAVTALFLACGYSFAEIGEISRLEDMNTFLDEIIPGRVPALGTFETKPRPPQLPSLINNPILKVGLLLAPLVFGAAQPVLVTAMGSSAALVEYLRVTAKLMTDGPLPAPIAAILNDSKKAELAALSLYWDYGVFPGEAVIRMLQKWTMLARARLVDEGRKIADGLFAMDPKERVFQMDDRWKSARGVVLAAAGVDRPGTTFKDVKRLFNSTLRITTSDLQSKKTQVFNPSTSPDMFVEDAVRMSMSLPFIFKPYVLNLPSGTSGSADTLFPAPVVPAPKAPNGPSWLTGVFVDGGLFNNTPVNVFPVPPQSGQVLGLRLTTDAEDAAKHPIQDFGSLVNQFLVQCGVFGSGESQISPTLGTSSCTIEIPKRKLDLLIFKPSAADYEDANRAAYELVNEYFGSPLVAYDRRPSTRDQ